MCGHFLDGRPTALIHSNDLGRDLPQHDNPFHALSVDLLTVLRYNPCPEQFTQLTIISKLKCNLVANFSLNRSVHNSESARCLNHQHVGRVRHQQFVQVYAAFNVIICR